MYFVDQKRISEIAHFMEQQLAELDTITESRLPMAKLALERIAEVLIEAVLDAGHLLIDGFVMRDAGSYEDILDILLDEQVIEAEEHGKLISLIMLRAGIVREYTAIDHKNIKNVLMSARQALAAYPKRIMEYLAKETEVAHAFGEQTRKEKREAE